MNRLSAGVLALVWLIVGLVCTLTGMFLTALTLTNCTLPDNTACEVALHTLYLFDEVDFELAQFLLRIGAVTLIMLGLTHLYLVPRLVYYVRWGVPYQVTVLAIGQSAFFGALAFALLTTIPLIYPWLDWVEAGCVDGATAVLRCGDASQRDVLLPLYRDGLTLLSSGLLAVSVVAGVATPFLFGAWQMPPRHTQKRFGQIDIPSILYSDYIQIAGLSLTPSRIDLNDQDVLRHRVVQLQIDLKTMHDNVPARDTLVTVTFPNLFSYDGLQQAAPDAWQESTAGRQQVRIQHNAHLTGASHLKLGFRLRDARQLPRLGSQEKTVSFEVQASTAQSTTTTARNTTLQVIQPDSRFKKLLQAWQRLTRQQQTSTALHDVNEEQSH